MDKEREAFLMYKQYYSAVEFMSDAQLGRLFRAIHNYQISGIEEVDDEIRMAFNFYLVQFKKDETKYDEVCKKRTAAIKKRWQRINNQCNNTNDSKDTNVYKCIQKNNLNTKQTDKEQEQEQEQGYKVSKDTMDTISSNEDNNIKESKLTFTKEKAAPTIVVATNEKGLTETEKKIKNREKREKDFYQELIPYVEVYGKEMVRDFYQYWTEPSKNKTLIRKDQQKTWDTARRLATWNRRNTSRTNGTNSSNITNYERAEKERQQRLATYQAVADDFRINGAGLPDGSQF